MFIESQSTKINILNFPCLTISIFKILFIKIKITKQSSSMDTEPDEYNDSYNQNEIRIHQSRNDDLSKTSKNSIFCKIHISIL